jgi:hypothetical protein
VALAHRGEWIIELDRPTRLPKDGAKSDHLNAARAASGVLGRGGMPRDQLNASRAHDGIGVDRAIVPA